jgi:hypothetical protein
MGLPRAQDTGGENPYIDPEDVLRLLIVGDSAVRLLSTLRVVNAAEKTTPTTKVLFEAKAAALHLERYQSSLSKLSTEREGDAGKEAQAIGLASQSDGQKSDGQTGDRQTS